jgi:hypothetical protein
MKNQEEIKKTLFFFINLKGLIGGEFGMQNKMCCPENCTGWC